ncbi:MAK10-like protein [Tanacetum coccineum]
MEDPGLLTLPCRLGDSEPFNTLADLGSCVNIIPLYLFKKLNIRLLEETGHIFILVDETKSYPVRIVKDVKVRIGKLKLLNDFYVIDMKKDLKTPLLVGRGFLATANVVIDFRMAKIAADEVRARTSYCAKKDFLDCHLPEEWEIARDVESNPFKDVMVFRRMNTNLFRAFTASANVPSIYIQQFWNTLTREAKFGVYNFQLDEQWFPLNADLLREALEITPPWRAMLTLINQCLTGKTTGSDKPRHHVLQMFRHNIHQRPESPVYVTGDNFPLGNLKFVPKGEKDEVFGKPIPK